MKNDEMQVLLPKSFLLPFARILLVGTFLLFQLSASAQDKTISGTVTGADGEPVIGVTVAVKGTILGTLSDVNGKYTLSIPPSARTIVFSFVGMETIEVEIGSANVYSVVLTESAVSLEEVVVVGYGTQKKITVTGAITSVQTSDLVKSPQASVANSLSGRVTGLTTVQYSGQPGADDPNVFVRGIGSLSSSASQPLMLVDGVERSFTQIDPNEIESISVLKDASATAVYGIRGANGVIIVTTKRGTEGTPKISFTSSAGLQMPSGLAEMADSYTWAQKYTQAQLSDNKYDPATTLVFSPYAMKALRDNLQPLIYGSVNWVDLLIKPSAFQSQQNINITGGSSVVKYFVSLGYLNQNGLLNTFDTDYSYNFGYKRYNYRANIDLDMTKSTKFSLTIGGTSGSTQSPSGWASTSWPTLWRSDPFSGQLYEGKRILVGTRYISFTEKKDGLDAIRWGRGFSRALSNVMNLDLGVTQKLDLITKGLNWRFKVSNNSTTGQTKTRSTSKATYDPWFLCDVDPTAIGDSTVVLKKSGADGLLGYSESSSKARNWYLETALSYERMFGSHQVTGLLLYNESKSYYPTSYSDIPTGYVGFAARATYNYKLKYMADFNLGYNGSENFAPGKRFGLFPAIAVGWTITEEDFLKNKIGFLDYLKLRYSYGIVGNDRIGGSRFLYNPNSYSINSTGYSFGTTIATSSLGASESTIGNPGVTWEKSTKQNLGIDLRILKGKLAATADVFYEYRANILTTRSTVPTILSMTLPAVNIGRVENKGYEVELKWRDKLGDFNYYISTNMSFSRNKILFMDEIPKNQPYLVQTGRSTGTRWGYVFDGFWTADEIDNHFAEYPNASYNPKPGDTRYKDIDGNNVINSDDQVVQGYPDYPEYIFSLSGGVDYKGFDLSFLFNASTNCTRVLSDTWQIPFQEIGQWALMKYIADNSWTPETASTAILPRITLTGRNNNYKSSDLYIRDASYIRLKNIELGYSFSAGILKRLGISRMRIYTNGFNLLTFSKLKIKGMDPESQTSGGRSYPLIKIANAGINVTF